MQLHGSLNQQPQQAVVNNIQTVPLLQTKGQDSCTTEHTKQN